MEAKLLKRMEKGEKRLNNNKVIYEEQSSDQCE